MTNKVLKTERISTKIQSKTMDKMFQSGTAVGSLTGRYVTFPVAFGAAPQVTASPMTGTVLWSRIRSAVAGSFSLAGSPTAKVFRWIAWGSV